MRGLKKLTPPCQSIDEIPVRFLYEISAFGFKPLFIPQCLKGIGIFPLINCPLKSM